MENTFTSVLFYLVPILIFGPLFFMILWFVGLRDIIIVPPAVKEQRRREREEAGKLAALKVRKRRGGRFTTREGAGLSPLAWTGQGVAYLPLSLAEDELALGRLVRAAGDAHDIPVEVVIHRPRARLTPHCERFWDMVTGN